MKNKHIIILLCEIFPIIISSGIFFISIAENIRDKYFCRLYENLIDKLNLTDNEQEIIKNNLLKKMKNWNIPHDSDLSGIILIIYLYIFGICLIPFFILLLIQYFYLSKRDILYRIIFLSVCILLIMIPSYCIVGYTIQIIRPIKIKNYFTSDENFILLLDKKILELNKRTIKMIVASLFILFSLILLVLELFSLIKEKKEISYSNNIEYNPIVESECVKFINKNKYFINKNNYRKIFKHHLKN